MVTSVGLEVEIEFAVARPDSSLHRASRDLEEITRGSRFDNGLLDHREILGFEADVVAARLADLGITEEVQATSTE